MQLDQEWIVQSLQDLALGVNLSKLHLVLLHTILLDEFHCVELSCRSFTHHVDRCEASGAKDLDEVEISELGHLLGVSLFLDFLPADVVDLEYRPHRQES